MNKKPIFSILLCISIFISSIMINPIAVAGDTTNANNWSDSDVRKFLNGSDDNAKGDYANYFTDAEYDVILSSEIKTNGSSSNDKFYLPGFFNNDDQSSPYDQVISWGTEEISESKLKEKISYLIPKAYWAENAGGANWLRSAYKNDNNYAHTYKRGDSADYASVLTDNGVAPLFHINMENVIFASSASAANLLALSSSGCERIPISDSSIIGQSSSESTPDYGMYLKTKDSNLDFQVNSVEYSPREAEWTIQYKGANIGKAIVVHMYPKDSLSESCVSYVAAKRLDNASGSCKISCLDWGLTSYDGLVMQIWMEDPKTGISMAQATEPQSFSCINGSFIKITPTIKNLRVFAMKEELACSWGDFESLTEEGKDNIINGSQHSADFVSPDGHYIGDTQMGPYATNQKIYFGIDSEGKPLAHWIAAHEKTGGTMCLYQTKAVEQRAFQGGTYQSALTIQITDANDRALTTRTLDCGDIGSVLRVSVSGGDSGGTITYQSSNPYVASVDETGEVKINNPGTFEILATNSGSGNYYSATIRSGQIVVADHNYSEFQDETGTHLKKCTQESCNSIVESHKPNYVAEEGVHVCSYDGCSISHDIEWEKKDESVHVCKTCNTTEDHTGEAATCDKVAVCSVCNSKYGTVDTNNHEYDLTTWKYDTTHHWHVCAEHEEAVLDKAAHTWSEWTMLERTRAVGESLKTRSCMVCGAIETEAIQNLPITPEDDIEQKPEGNPTGNQTMNGSNSTGVLPDGAGQSSENGQTGNVGTTTDMTVVSPKTGIEENFVYILSAFIVVSGAVMVYKKRNILKK